MPQFFKGDDQEKKIYGIVAPILSVISSTQTEFFNQAYNTAALGDMIFDTGRTPLVNAIPREIFRESFAAIFAAFERPGTFDGYITVFKTIFGDDVQITFTVPGPGRLNIDIVAAGVQLNDWVARRVEAGEFVDDDVIDNQDDNIAFQTIKGFESEYELGLMLFEMVPGGIYTQISLALGG